MPQILEVVKKGVMGDSLGTCGGRGVCGDPSDSTGDEARLILTPPLPPQLGPPNPPPTPLDPLWSARLARRGAIQMLFVAQRCSMQSSAPGQGAPAAGCCPPTLSIVSDPSTPQARLLALLAVPHSAMSVGAVWKRVATSIWWPVVETRDWNCGTQCEMWGVPLVCLFHNPILVSIVAPLELGLGIHNSRFVAGPLEVGLGTRNSRFVVWPLVLGLGTRSPCFVAWPLDLGLGTHKC